MEPKDFINPRLKARLSQVLIPLGLLVSLHPSVSSALALLLGVSLALIFGNPYLARTRKLTKPMLAWSIIGLGAGVNLMVVLKAGSSGLLFTACSLGLTLLAGYGLSRIFKTNQETSSLINVGTAICGGSAIAAVASAIRAKDESISVSLGIVFILNALALFIFPALGHWLQLSEDQFGLWAALAIHDTSSVVGATMQYGPRALEVGTTVKLVRVLWIIPVSFLFAKMSNSQNTKTTYPWFILGFLLTSALATWFAVLAPYAQGLEWLARRTLVATLFLIGSGLTIANLKQVGVKALAHGVTLWILVAIGSLLAVY